ncbi:homoserine O-acetyltransferase [Batrachochytrium salamandrivorans]|nr:homoserine O-acetyltransferase [Batrachochytrium salamandrivorans]
MLVTETRESVGEEKEGKAAITTEETLVSLDMPVSPFACQIRNQSYIVLDSFQLESGMTLDQPPVAYKTWGKLNAAGTNVIVICHALSGSADVEDWWGELLGPGRPFNTSKFFVFCGNVLGSPYGTASPCTINPATGQKYGPTFPLTTVRDDVRLHRQVLDRLGVRQVMYCIGGSMGGMQVLEWALCFGPTYIQHIVPLATSGRLSAWGIGWNEIQRQAIYADPNYGGGYYSDECSPNSGLAAARMMAIMTYRTRGSFEDRFGRQTMPKLESEAPVVSKAEMEHNEGTTFGRGDYSSALASITQKGLVIGIESDVLFTVEDQRALAYGMPNAEVVIVPSKEGHDGFLLELETIRKLLYQFIQPPTLPLDILCDVEKIPPQHLGLI